MYRATALSILLSGCAPRAPATPTPAPTATAPDPGVDVAAARQLNRKPAFSWAPWSAETFRRARADDKLILVHGAATWCHWCHVMEETTYRDPEVGRLIAERFVAIRVDIDARPDIEERYADWGWPATIVLSPDAEELAKMRGYLAPDRMRRELLGLLTAVDHPAESPRPRPVPAAVDQLPWVGRQATLQLDRYYDPDQASWGRGQKVPLGDAAAFELVRAERGDTAARRRAVASLDAHARLIDPVWGGVYQYSTDGDWEHPHFEKLMTYQAENISAFARGYSVTGQARHRDRAYALVRYVNRFLSNGDGAFLVTQDADLGGHDHDAVFVEGHDYYRRDEAARSKLGIPRVDDHVYAEENGLAIAAYCDLYDATTDVTLRDRAERAAGSLLKSHLRADGAVAHDAGRFDVVYLADAAAFGHGLARLHEATQNDGYREAALRIAQFLDAALRDEETGALWAHTPDPDAFGVFARRRRPFDANVMAARLFARLFRITGDVIHRDRARQVLAAIATPDAVADQGRMIGAFLLALDEAESLAW